ncbi:MAG: exo-beta-N-acetylmuramidase NamZ domain-containing protein, partial [Chitinivibrionales bacterium]
LKGKRCGLLCHAASVTPEYRHALSVLKDKSDIEIAAVFGPQHGIFGQTQDNMIEWRGGFLDPVFNLKVYSLYGDVRKPSDSMLEGLDLLLIDIQDVGARPYTYIWTMKLCMEACAEKGLGVCVLDRPNPVSELQADGPLLRSEYFSFVGGASIPMCHRMTPGEIALLLKETCFTALDFKVMWMEDWERGQPFESTGLPWILPSPNMPWITTAFVYPGTVLLEATNVSEGRGTTRPFEFAGAPWIDISGLMAYFRSNQMSGCVVRRHDFIPAFQKWSGKYCYGFQIHVTDPSVFRPVRAAAEIIRGITEVSDRGFEFKDPPYEYEYTRMPFDILSGDTRLRDALMNNEDLRLLFEEWDEETAFFSKEAASYLYYSGSLA